MTKPPEIDVYTRMAEAMQHTNSSTVGLTFSELTREMAKAAAKVMLEDQQIWAMKNHEDPTVFQRYAKEKGIE